MINIDISDIKTEYEANKTFLDLYSSFFQRKLYLKIRQQTSHEMLTHGKSYNCIFVDFDTYANLSDSSSFQMLSINEISESKNYRFCGYFGGLEVYVDLKSINSEHTCVLYENDIFLKKHIIQGLRKEKIERLFKK